MKKEKLPGVHAMRGYAALIVVLCHAADAIARHAEDDRFHWLIEGGFIGVCFFFVLSGFIMNFIHGNDAQNLKSGKVFVEKRLVRLVPIYWIMTIVVFLALQVNPSFGENFHHTLPGLLTSLFFIPVQDGSVLRVGWTLIHEMLFYLIFAIAFYAIRLPKLCFILWSSIILFIAIASNYTNILAFPTGEKSNIWLVVLASPLNILFGIGLVSSSSAVKAWRDRWLSESALWLSLLASIGLVLLVWKMHEHSSSFLHGANSWLRPMIYGSLSFVLLIVVSDRRVGQRLDNAVNRLLGDASYSIYLVHYYAIAAMAITCKKLAPWIIPNTLLMFLLLVFGGILSGIAFHYLVERRVTSFVVNLRK